MTMEHQICDIILIMMIVEDQKIHFIDIPPSDIGVPGWSTDLCLSIDTGSGVPGGVEVITSGTPSGVLRVSSEGGELSKLIESGNCS